MLKWSDRLLWGSLARREKAARVRRSLGDARRGARLVCSSGRAGRGFPSTGRPSLALAAGVSPARSAQPRLFKPNLRVLAAKNKLQSASCITNGVSMYITSGGS